MNGNECLLIFVSLESWDDIWRRNQFVCAELARRFPDMRILFVCPPRDVSNAVRTRRLGLLRGPNNWHPEGFDNITVTRPLKLLPSTLAVGRWINDVMTRAHIRKVMKKLEERGGSLPQRRDDTTGPEIHKEVAEVTEGGDGGLRVIGLAGQPAGRGLDGDDYHNDTTTESYVGIHKEVAEVTEGGDGGLRVTGLAGQTAGRGLDGDDYHNDTTTESYVGIHKEVAEVTEGGDGGLRVTGLAGQPAGRGYNGGRNSKSGIQRPEEGKETLKADIVAYPKGPAHDECSLNRMHNVLLWLNPQDAVHMVGRMGESRVIYDITDDWTQFTHFTERKGLLARTIAEDAELCRRADSVIVCSRSLYESRQALSRDIHLIPNGVDAAHYRCVLDEQGPLPEACRNWPRPVFGYTGSIHADRVDVKLLEAMTAAMKGQNIPGTIVLIGPVMLPAEQQRQLEGTGRVIFTGPMAYRDLPQYMRAFDVCIVPHCMTAFVESLNPIKLWEYLAAGKPIVSTDVAGFRDYPALVRMARTADEFLTQCGAAVLEGNTKSALRRAEAARHSWRSRVDEIVKVMKL